jgi:hypothetical protein
MVEESFIINRIPSLSFMRRVTYKVISGLPDCLAATLGLPSPAHAQKLLPETTLFSTEALSYTAWNILSKYLSRIMVGAVGS